MTVIDDTQATAHAAVGDYYRYSSSISSAVSQSGVSR
jgi:hypothetical protein